MALADELTALVAHAGRGVLDDATSFGAALDDYVSPEAASRGVLNLLVDAVRQGALERLLRDIEHGADPARAVAACGDQLARDRAATDVGPSRWAVALLGYAVGAVDRQVLDAQAPPDTAAPPAAPPAPTMPPTAARPPAGPPPPVAPLAAPLTAPPAWAPYDGQRPARRRTGLVVGGVLLAVAVIAGGIVAAVVLADDPPRAKTVDDPTIAIVTSEGTATGGTDEGSDGLLTEADPVAIADLLSEVALESFPGATQADVTAQSWSTEATNLTDGFPRDLAVGERDQATDWGVRTEVDQRAMGINVEHEPSDGGTFYDWSCDTFTSSGTTEAECSEVQTSDGRTAIEYWYRDPEIGIATHAVAIPSDYATRQPQVLVTERLPDAPRSMRLAGLKDVLQLSGADLLRIAEDPRLQLPRPSPEPALPSYGYCVNTQPRPTECPADIS